jgi:UDP-N-acetylglucosamine 3-dehydrogenase
MSSVLLVGLGNMGRKYLNKFLELGLKPTLCDINEKLKEEFKEFNFYCFYDEIEKHDKVFVAVNPKYHPRIAEYYLSKGSYVFLEKPPALNYEEFKKLVEKFGSENLGVSEIERYSYAVKGFEVPKKVKSIEIFRLNRGKGYINPIWDLAWHDFYLLLYLFGDFEMTETSKIGEYHYTIEGFTEKGIPFRLSVAWNYPKEVKRYWSIKTEKGEIVLDFLNERRLENGKVTSERKEKDKLREMVEDVLENRYDASSVKRALKILKKLEILTIT